MRDRGPPKAFITITSVYFYKFRLRVYLTLRFLATRNLTHTHRFAGHAVRIALNRGDMTHHVQTCFIVLFPGSTSCLSFFRGPYWLSQYKTFTQI